MGHDHSLGRNDLTSLESEPLENFQDLDFEDLE
jgi:hypothetical protein